jgi:hypothetical protein
MAAKANIELHGLSMFSFTSKPSFNTQHTSATEPNFNTCTQTIDSLPNMAAAPPAYDGVQGQQKTETAKGFEATISATLEISSFDLAVLKRHLIAQNWVPASTDEDLIEDAVFRFRRTYRTDRAYQINLDYENTFKDNKRLTTLFDVWASEQIREMEVDYDHDPKSLHELELQRETAKYDAVRALFAHLAVRKNGAGSTSTKGDLTDLSDEQVMNLLKTNARVRALFVNNVKRSIVEETETLRQKIAEKDAELTGILRSLA